MATGIVALAFFVMGFLACLVLGDLVRAGIERAIWMIEDELEA